MGGIGGSKQGGGGKSPATPDYVGLANQLNNENYGYNADLQNRGNTSSAIIRSYLDKWGGPNAYDGKRVGDALYGSVMDRGRKEQTRETDAMNTQLRNQGLEPGSEAYNRAMQNLMTSQNDANLLAAQNATIAGANEGRAQRSSDINQVAALYGLIQPKYNAVNPMDAASAQYQADYGKYAAGQNASNSKKGGLLGAGASLGGSYLGSK